MGIEYGHNRDVSCKLCKSDRTDALEFMSLRYPKDGREIVSLEFQNKLLQELLQLKESGALQKFIPEGKGLEFVIEFLNQHHDNCLILSQENARLFCEQFVSLLMPDVSVNSDNKAK